MVGLIDCNSFYASCEQVFRPDLWGKPVVVLSNNDGCIIAANKEAKALAHIPMFEPVFKIKEKLIRNNVTLFSSNYTLYGEMSERVMNTLRNFSPLVEVYSIDEAFVDFSGMKNITAHGRQIKKTIMRHTGIPVGVGIAPTKVLAKLANRMAKKIEAYDHVCVIDTEEKRIEALQWAKIKDIWGIGKNHAKLLERNNVFTGYDFVKMPLKWVRKNMTVVGERMWRELRGEVCLPLQVLPKPKKAIGTAKSFGKKLKDLSLIEEAFAHYISEVAEVLRRQKACAKYLQVFLQTNYHSQRDRQYAKSITITLDIPTDSTFVLATEGKKALRSIFKPGYRYKKVGVCLSGIIPMGTIQGNLFQQEPDQAPKKLMQTIDFLNQKYGKETVFPALNGVRKKEWELIKNERSPRFTTQWNELLMV